MIKKDLTSYSLELNGNASTNTELTTVEKKKRVKGGRRGRPPKSGGSISKSDMVMSDNFYEDLDRMSQDGDTAEFIRGYVVGLERFSYYEDGEY